MTDHYTDDSRVIVLGPLDSAFIFRADGSEESIFPTAEDEHGQVCASAMKGMFVAMALHDEVMAQVFQERVEAIKRG